MVTEVKEEHRENALSPIVVTLFGMVTVVKKGHRENAYFPTVVIPSEMVNFSIESFVSSHG